jgi:hypothetical protein
VNSDINFRRVTTGKMSMLIWVEGGNTRPNCDDKIVRNALTWKQCQRERKERISVEERDNYNAATGSSRT